MPDRTGDFIWYELITPDPDGARAFYESVVAGWTIDAAGEAMPNGIEYRMIRRSDGKEQGGILTLSADMQAHGARPMWAGYISVDDVDSTIDAIRSDGGEALMPAFDIPDIGRIAMVADPAGVPFYVMKAIPPAGQPDAKSDVFDGMKAEHVRWNELSTTDQDRAIAFYGRHFGWTQEGGMPMGEMGDYKFIQAHGESIGAIMRKPAQSPASSWLYYIGVDDIDRATTAITAGGGQKLYDPMEIPGGEYAVAGIDPQGAAFGLVGPRK
jgi:predicted enzyme related to lactoylglutathione lyase